MYACMCGERNQPIKSQIPSGSNQRPRQWLVTRRNESCSAFNGYRPQWSAYSDVRCKACGAYWRTKASFVNDLEDDPDWPFGPPRTPGKAE